MEIDGLYVLADAAFLPELEAELLTFPAGVHDDQVDALGLVGQLLDKMKVGRPIEQLPDDVELEGKLSMTFDQLMALQPEPQRERA